MQTEAVSTSTRPFRYFRQKVNDFRFFVLLALLLFGVFLFLMTRQAKIVQLSYQNAADELALKRLRVAMVQRQEDIHKNLDLNNVRSLAQAAGLFAPQEGQILRLKINQKDFIRIANQKNLESEELEREIEMAMQSVGDYFEKKRVEKLAKSE